MIYDTETGINVIEIDVVPKSMEYGNFEIDGTGRLSFTATGGSSAAEGGMGSGGGEEKGAGIKDAEGNPKSDTEPSEKADADEPWDPLKPKEEKEKGR